MHDLFLSLGVEVLVQFEIDDRRRLDSGLDHGLPQGIRLLVEDLGILADTQHYLGVVEAGGILVLDVEHPVEGIFIGGTGLGVKA